VLFKFSIDIGQGELGSVDGDLDFAQNPGQAADVVLVAVGENNCTYMCSVFNEVRDIRDDNVNAKEL